MSNEKRRKIIEKSKDAGVNAVIVHDIAAIQTAIDLNLRHLSHASLISI